MKIPSYNTPIDISDYPHLDAAGKQFIKEIQYQMYENENWSNSEKAWLGAIRNQFIANVISYEEAIQEAYQAGVQATNEQLFENGKDNDYEADSI